jgi:arsenate reductase
MKRFFINFFVDKKRKIIFVCTGNACRSQIAEGLLRNLASNKFSVFSAGSHPSQVHPMSVAVMEEVGIDISHHTSDPISDYVDHGIDVVITVCDNAKQACPVFPGNVEHIHWSIEDPFNGWDFDPLDLDNFRKVREDINSRIKDFLQV